MVENANEKMRVGNVKKRKMNKTLKFILIFLIIVLMVLFFIYVTIRYTKHPEKIPFLIGYFRIPWMEVKRNNNEQED